MPEGHDSTIEVSNIMSFVLYTQILKQSVLKPASPGITLNRRFGSVFVLTRCFLDFSVGVRAFVIGLSQISFFSS